ncbi:MAG: leucine-rich repeat domain-containing protein [Oligoflexales bacterium]
MIKIKTIIMISVLWLPTSLFGQEKVSFLTICENPGSDSIKHTIDVLKQTLKTESCSETALALEQTTEIWISEAQIESLVPFATLENLTKLELPYNQIVDISPLSSLKKLQILDLSGNQIKNIKPLKDLVILSELDLTENKIEDISVLGTHTDLIFLELSENPAAINQSAKNCPKNALSDVVGEFCSALDDE